MTSRHRGGNPYGYPPAADMGGMYNNANDNYDPHKKERYMLKPSLSLRGP
jgi:hypothetical protein